MIVLMYSVTEQKIKNLQNFFLQTFLIISNGLFTDFLQLFTPMIC